MERFSRGLTFWVLLVVSLVPAIASGQTLQKVQKCLYSANVMKDGAGEGSASLVVTTKLYSWPNQNPTTSVDVTYRARSLFPGVDKVDLKFDNPVPGSVVSLCDNSGADLCDVDSSNNLFISGSLSNGQLPGGFGAAVTNGYLRIEFNDGGMGTGNFTLAQACSCRLGNGQPCGG